ncbi:glycosyltransferase family protein [Microbacterium halophytorum]|uniref:glycosyltransferase family protein n=1 Tax=Microbacterium halophytorum TaxID=2067568 RepID=UPI000CFC7011|nr:glycosyltransferase [Microbacterium halophytorum]
MSIRIVMYSHDAVGLGHIRRNLALAHALTTGLGDVTGMLVAGRPEATRFAVPRGWDWLILPGMAHADDGYASRALDIDVDAAAAVRGGAFRSAVRAFRPDLVVIDRHPLGVGGELERALRTLRAEHPECRVVLGLRDVLDAPGATAREWRAIGGPAAMREFFDAIWVYGDPNVHDLAADGELPAGVSDLVSHTGLLADGRVAGAAHDIEEPFVLTTVGGGSDGAELAVAAAGAEVPRGYRHLVITGPQMAAADRRAVQGAAREGTTVVRRVPDALPLMQRAAAVVCMGGYNTICEVLSTATPALVAPRMQRRAEQRIRAAALERVGAVETLLPWRIDADTIGAWFGRSVGTRVERESLALDGLARVPQLAADLLGVAAGAAAGGERVAV